MVFKKGSRGDKVKQIQIALGLEADGIFGIKTESAVIEFQKENGLYPDGIVGEKTMDVLNVNFDTDLFIINPFDLNFNIDEYYLPKWEYLDGNYKNDYIVLHHTAGGANPRSVVDCWSKDSIGKVATEFVVGGQNCKNGSAKYDGQIVRTFPEGCQGYHIGKSGSTYMNTHSVGIEICNFGYIKDGKTYTGTVADSNQIITLESPFKGFLNWHKYSDEQINAVRDLLLYISNRDNIDLHEGLYRWINEEGVMKAFDFHMDAYEGNVKGLLTHTNIRKDKFDCSPQPNLVDMIMTL
jgi:flagellar assembly factor FliW